MVTQYDQDLFKDYEETMKMLDITEINSSDAPYLEIYYELRERRNILRKLLWPTN